MYKRQSFLFPGPGYGGSCFPKDVKALVRTAREAQVPLRVLESVEEANDRQKERLFAKLSVALGGELRGLHVAIWGLAFKPNTDDMFEAPSRYLLADLFAAGATVCAHDPVAMDETRRIYGDEPRLSYAATPMEALAGADALVIVTEWKVFRSPDFAAIKAALKTPVIFDGRNLYDPATPRAAGVEYFAIGR